MDRFKKKAIAFFKQRDNILILSIIGSVLLACCAVIPVRLSNPSKRTLDMIRFPGDLFFNLLKMCILPVVVCSILRGVTSMNIRTSRKLGFVSLIYFLSTTFLASIVGCTIVEIIQPGKYATKSNSSDAVKQRPVQRAEDSIMDLLRNLFPENLVEATFQQVQTKYRNETILSGNETNYEIKRVRGTIDGTNYMGIIFFCIFFGFVLMTYAERAQPIINMIELLNDISMRMILYIIMLSPVGIFFLLVATMANFKNFQLVVQGMGMYCVTAVIGLSMLWLVIYPALYFIFVRKNPYKVIAKTTKATLYSFAVCSSSATLPITLRCCEENLRVRQAVTRFILPIAAVVNMDGTSVHEGAAALFIAQLNGIHQSFGEKLLVCIMGGVSSIACSTTPGAGIVALLIVLTAAGLPTDDISLFFMTDWILSRVRTATNVLGDSFATAIVEKICEKDLEKVAGKEKAKEEQKLMLSQEYQDGAPKEDVQLSQLAEIV